MQAAFLTRPTTGTVRGTRTTPLRDDRAVSLYIKPTPASPLVEEPRQVPWLAYFIGLSAILALVNVFIPPVTQEGSQFSADSDFTTIPHRSRRSGLCTTAHPPKRGRQPSSPRLAIAECPELWASFHDENLIFTKRDFQSPRASPLFAKLRTLKTLQQFIGIFEKACGQDPLDCPALLDLVKPSSKLPWWMRPRIEVQIKTLTREAQAQLTTQPVGLCPNRRCLRPCHSCARPCRVCNP